MRNTKTILVSTYAVNPTKGSEDGMGWNYIMQIARFQKVIAITRENNQEHIEKYMQENPKEEYKNIQFLYFDLPYWMRFWKKGSRGAMLYFWLWQISIVKFIKKQKITFDITHNLNFHNDWTPSYLWKLGKPFVWGPIGHHPLIPKQYLKNYSYKYYIKNRLTWLIKKYFWNYSFSLKRTVKNASFIYTMNSSVPKMLNLKKTEHIIFPSVASEDFGYLKNKNNKKFTLISAGRLVPLKGYDLTILSFASFLHTLTEEEKRNCELIIVGSGSEMNYYKRLTQKENVQQYVTFIDWIERNELMQLFKKASTFIFPSHEGAGMVVPEALSFGLPIICLDNEGPGEFIDDSCGFAIPNQEYSNTILNLQEAISKLYKNPERLKEMQQNARQKFIKKFHWDRRGEILNTIYSKL